MQYSQFRHQYVALALDYNSTGMGSYHQPVPEICTLKYAFIGKEHVAVVTRKGKEGFLCIQIFRKVILVPYTLSMASKKDKCSGEKCSLCSGNNNGRQQAHPQKWSVELQTFVMEVTVLMKCDDVCTKLVK